MKLRYQNSLENYGVGVKRLRGMGMLECFYYISKKLLADYVPWKGSEKVFFYQRSKKCISEKAASLIDH